LFPQYDKSSPARLPWDQIRSQGFDWNGQLRRPAQTLLVQKHRFLHATFEVCKASRKNIQIDPHSVGTYFELPVVARSRWIRLKEGLGHIAVPQVVPAAVTVGVFKDEKLPIAAFKPQIKSL
jgi:hypothetical protein